MYTIVDGYAMALWCDTEGKTWAAIAIMANFQSFVWWQRFFEIHTHDHHWRSVALIKQKQPATDGYDKKRLPPLIAPKNFFTQADKKRTACYFQYWINSFHRKCEQWYDVAWFSRFISPLRQKKSWYALLGPCLQRAMHCTSCNLCGALQKMLNIAGRNFLWNLSFA